MNIKDDFILKEIDEGYLVGGSVRDFVMGKSFNDRDIAIKNAEEFAKKLAEKFSATFITLDSDNKIYRLVLKDKENYLDISELRGNCIEDDLKQRDLTINAVAYDLKNEELIDITGGLKDIKNGILRSINEANFIDDPLRILRVYRFMATTGFDADAELLSIVNKHKNLINEPAKERVHDEILKLFSGKYASKTLICMLESGILEIIFPCVNELKQVPPNAHHHLDLIHHSIETVRQIELQEENSVSDVLEHIYNTDLGGYPVISYIKLAGFLHDIGKFSTWTIENVNGKERHRFIKHDSVGAKLVVPLLKELKFSNKQIEKISFLIKHHIYPSNVVASPNFDQKVMMRFVRKMEDNVIDIIFIAKADRLSAQGPEVTEDITNANINGLNKLLNFYLEIKSALKPLPKLLDGNDIMKILNIKQSPDLGKIIQELHEAQINGEVNTKSEAELFVKNFGK